MEHDDIRDKILRFLYEKHRTARGIKGVAIGIREIQSALKEHHIKSNEVNSNLDYLIQKGWIKTDIQTKYFTTRQGTTRPSEKKTYKISDIGIDMLQGASLYRRENNYSKINVTNISGVTVIGSGNIVNSQHTDLSRLLSELEQLVNASSSLSEEDKLNALSDIASIQSQLSKPKPNFKIIKTIWEGIKNFVTAGDFIDLVSKISSIILSN